MDGLTEIWLNETRKYDSWLALIGMSCPSKYGSSRAVSELFATSMVRMVSDWPRKPGSVPACGSTVDIQHVRVAAGRAAGWQDCSCRG